MPHTTLLRAGLLALLLVAPLAAQDSRPAQAAPTLGQVLQAAREAKVLVEGTRRQYFKGQNPGVALVDHETRITKTGLSAAFTEHAPSGAFVRSTYRIDAEGVLQEVKIERGTRDSYPEASETTSYRREKDQLVEVVKEGEQPEARELPRNAIPMSVVTFLLPTLSAHLPERLEFTPLFEAEIHGQSMTLTRSSSEAGSLLGIEFGGQQAISIEVDPRGRIKQLNAPGGNVIKQLTSEAGEAALAKLRPA